MIWYDMIDLLSDFLISKKHGKNDVSDVRHWFVHGIWIWIIIKAFWLTGWTYKLRMFCSEKVFNDEPDSCYDCATISTKPANNVHKHTADQIKSNHVKEICIAPSCLHIFQLGVILAQPHRLSIPEHACMHSVHRAAEFVGYTLSQWQLM